VCVEEDGGSDLTNVQCKPIQNCHNDSPLNHEYMLIKYSLIKIEGLLSFSLTQE
jgi:hypothetical protein